MSIKIKKIALRDQDFDQSLSRLLDRENGGSDGVEETVRQIIREVRDAGDDALLRLTEKFDGQSFSHPNDLEIPKAEWLKAIERLSPALFDALQEAAGRIRAFHEKQKESSWELESNDGSRLGQQVTPMDRVGIYVPGGQAAYPSSVLMNAIPAQVAGVAEIIMVVPTPRGEVNDAVLACAHIANVDRIFRIGGAQAIAALAYGTQTIPKVDKIVGPGNQYVAAAKKMVFGDVGIDMIAGPSEVAVICDAGADPDWVAMDLFAQAEHDEKAQSIAICIGSDVAAGVESAIERILPSLERQSIIERSLADHGAIILVDSVSEAIDVANRIAPEHLELMVREPRNWLAEVRHAGAIFCGDHSAESLGDYCAGPNHVLPTSGTARFSSPLGVYDFQKRSSIIDLTQSAAASLSRVAATIARAEGLTAHARSADYRGSEGSKNPRD